ncbi:MAG: AsmA family protein [Pseudorhodoplanes sp.]|nr:AsmA family protein [Pseudorhodoplanes sp.]
MVSFLIPADQVRETVKADIRAVTGLDPVLNGAVSVSLFPYGKVSFSDVVLGDSGEGQPPLIADRLTVKLRFFPLLTGRVEVADVALEGPRITLALREDGRSNWAPLIASLTRAHHPEATRRERSLSFSEIPHRRRHRDRPRRSPRRAGTAEQRQSLARLAGHFEKLRRHRLVLLARRDARHERRLRRFRRAPARAALGPEDQGRRRAGEILLRRRDEPAPDAEGRGRDGRRQPLAAQGAALVGPAAAARRRLRGVLDLRQDQHRRRHHRADRGEPGARRQRRGGRAHLRDRRTPDPAGHAGLGDARPVVLCLHHAPARRQPARMEPRPDRDRGPQQLRPRPAAVGRQDKPVERQTRPHRGRRQPEVGQARGDGRRVARPMAA